MNANFSIWVIIMAGEPVAVGSDTVVIVAVDGLIVERRVVGSGVEVIVLSLPDIVVTMVVGLGVETIVLRDPPMLVITVKESGIVSVGVVTISIVVGVPPTTDVNTRGGGVRTMVVS